MAGLLAWFFAVMLVLGWVAAGVFVIDLLLVFF